MELFTENPLVPKIVQLLVLILSLATAINGE